MHEATTTRVQSIRERLLTRRRDLLARYHDAIDRSSDPIVEPEPVDAAAGQWDAHVVSIMSSSDVRALARVAAALRRLDAGTYGVCSVCGAEIAPARLRVIPEASECTDCVEIAEEQRRAS